jgi:predicted RNase H-like HicB family nuclease
MLAFWTAQATWGRFPDLPGCYSGGAFPKEATCNAISAAREWTEDCKLNGEEIPAARTAANLIAAGEIDIPAGEDVVMVPFDAARSAHA